MIARLPRESISFRSAARAGLMVAVAFEIFKQVASIYLKSVVPGLRVRRSVPSSA